MKVLALETATDFAGIAIVHALHPGNGGAEFIFSSSRENNEKIMVFIHRLLEDTRLELKDIDLFAAGIGPGLYTGLRVGLSIMKGLSIFTNKPLVGIPTLNTIASNFLGCREKIVVVLNAYGGEAYGAVYDVEKTIKRQGDYFICPIEEMVRKIGAPKKSSNGFILSGPGLRIYKERMKKILGSRAVFASEENWIPRPASLARLAVERFKKGHLPHPDKVLPLYLKESEAERRWKRLHSHC